MQSIEDQHYDEYRQRQLDCEHDESYEENGYDWCLYCDKRLGKHNGRQTQN